MADQLDDQPRATPARPKGSGSRAPWIALALVVVIGMAVLISIGIGVVILRT